MELAGRLRKYHKFRPERKRMEASVIPCLTCNMIRNAFPKGPPGFILEHQPVFLAFCLFHLILPEREYSVKNRKCKLPLQQLFRFPSPPPDKLQRGKEKTADRNRPAEAHREKRSETRGSDPAAGIAGTPIPADSAAIAAKPFRFRRRALRKDRSRRSFVFCSGSSSGGITFSRFPARRKERRFPVRQWNSRCG